MMVGVLSRLGLLSVALLVLVLLANPGARAESGGRSGSGSPAMLPQESRIALVVGNSAYRHTAELVNPLNDARDVARALQRAAFEVIVATDADKRQMDGALRAFAEKLATAHVALFFYAGHGLQVGNQNYLVPTDARLATQRDLEFETVKLDFVLRQMEIDRDGKTTIVMLDACRDNPLTRSLARSMGTRSTAIGQGLAPASTGVGTFIAYATQPGNVALDGKGRNSPFTAALLANIHASGRNLNATMIEVRKSVIKATDGRQVPWDHSALTGDFFFVPGEVQAGSQSRAPAGRDDDVSALKARLKALEEAELRRRERGGGSTAAIAGEERVAKMAEARARLAVAEDKVKELQAKLFEARRAEVQGRDPAERQRLAQASMRIQSEMTRTSLTAARLKDEIAGLAAPPKPVIASPGQRSFNVRLGLRAVGEPLATTQEAAECESRCRGQPRCLAYNVSNTGACELVGEVARTVSASEWRMGERPCEMLGIGWATPLQLAAGIKLCNGIGQHEARVERVGEATVAFSAEGRDFTCKAGDICQFNWPASPLFTVRIGRGEGRAFSAELVPHRP